MPSLKNILKNLIPVLFFGAIVSACSDYATHVEIPERFSYLYSSQREELPVSEESSAGSSSSFCMGDLLREGKIKIVLRDFQSNHPDFENFAEEAYYYANDIYNYKAYTNVAMNENGYDDDWLSAQAYHITCGNENSFPRNGVGIQIGVDGLSLQKNPNLPPYLQQVSSAPVLKYGSCLDNGYSNFLRGYENTLGSFLNVKSSCRYFDWSKDVIYTPGMVKPYLEFVNLGNGSIDMVDGVIIKKQKEACDNRFFEQWFFDVKGVNKRTNTVMNLDRQNEFNDFLVDNTYNRGGFFPLDSVNPLTQEWVMQKPCDISSDGVCSQYVPQGLSIYCPPYNYRYAGSQIDYFRYNTYELCKNWLGLGGPRAVNPLGDGESAAMKAAEMQGEFGLLHLRNYDFTMMGYTTFKYNVANQESSHEFLEFGSGDDLWVFVDGVLVVDLGGTHLVATGKVDLNTLAVNNHGCHAGEPLSGYSNCNGASDESGWADGSLHHVHIFYVNRQIINADFYFRAHLN